MRTALFALTGLLILPACSTISGVGKDVSAVGRGLSHVADEVRDEVCTRDSDRRYTETRYTNQYSVRPTVVVKEPCDPSVGELKVGSGLPPCPRVYYRR